MGRLGFYINIDSCIGCRTCQVACKDRNDLEIGYLFRRVDTYETGIFPNAKMYHYSHSCNHCASPACVANCPTAAMQKADDGTVQHDDGLCIGCETCVKSCPYGVPQLIKGEGIVRKCDACAPFREAGKNPVCVDACPMRCLEFGDLDELAEKHGSDLVQELPMLPSKDETDPSILINPKPCALEKDFRAQSV